MSETLKLTTAEIAHFAARGFVRLDAVVDDDINRQFLADIGDASPQPQGVSSHYRDIMQASVIPLIEPGTPLARAYADGSALERLVNAPAVAGAIQSLVGADCVVDHHFLHITFPSAYHDRATGSRKSQHTHQDSTVDPRQAFDVQLFYFPHEVTAEMGGTRFVPGSHFRVVSEAALARYQNIRGQQHVVCPAGTVIFFHMGLWHGGGLNRSDELRYMFKIRLCPTARQLGLWDVDSTQPPTSPRPIFWTDGTANPDHLHAILTRPERWFEADTGRLEYINRIKFWRYITGDDHFDADYWLTRIENEYP